MQEYKTVENRRTIREQILKKPAEIEKPQTTFWKTDVQGPMIGVKNPWNHPAMNRFPNSDPSEEGPFRSNRPESCWKLIPEPRPFKIQRLLEDST